MKLNMHIVNEKLIPYYNKLLNKLDSNQLEDEYPDSGIDLACPEDVTIPPGETVRIDLGIQCAAFVREYLGNNRRGYPSPYYLYPRSSLSNTPLRLANSVGIIDSGYRGNIMATVDNIKTEPYVVKAGTRLFQICSPDLSPITVFLVNQLNKTARGEGGFGSTDLPTLTSI